MEEREKKLISSNKSIYVTNTKLSEVSSKKENASTDEEQLTKSCKLPGRIKLSSSKGSCSKSCTEYKETVTGGARPSDCKPQTLRESSSGQKKLETKPLAKTPLPDQVKTKLKGTSQKLQSTLPFFEKATKRTLGRIKSFYLDLKDDLKARRVLGFKCDLKKCDSTLAECSARSCKKKSMIFGGPAHPYDPEDSFDSSTSDTSTISLSGTSEKDRKNFAAVT